MKCLSLTLIYNERKSEQVHIPHSPITWQYYIMNAKICNNTQFDFNTSINPKNFLQVCTSTFLFSNMTKVSIFAEK